MKNFKNYVPPLTCVLLSFIYLTCALIPNPSEGKTMIAWFGFWVLFLAGVGGIIFVTRIDA